MRSAGRGDRSTVALVVAGTERRRHRPAGADRGWVLRVDERRGAVRPGAGLGADRPADPRRAGRRSWRSCWRWPPAPTGHGGVSRCRRTPRSPRSRGPSPTMRGGRGRTRRCRCPSRCTWSRPPPPRRTWRRWRRWCRPTSASTSRPPTTDLDARRRGMDRPGQHPPPGRAAGPGHRPPRGGSLGAAAVGDEGRDRRLPGHAPQRGEHRAVRHRPVAGGPGHRGQHASCGTASTSCAARWG